MFFPYILWTTRVAAVLIAHVFLVGSHHPHLVAIICSVIQGCWSECSSLFLAQPRFLNAYWHISYLVNFKVATKIAMKMVHPCFQNKTHLKACVGCCCALICYKRVDPMEDFSLLRNLWSSAELDSFWLPWITHEATHYFLLVITTVDGWNPAPPGMYKTS